MFPKALWMKEWKHASVICFSLLLTFIVAYPVMIGTQMDTWRGMMENDPEMWQQVQSSYVNMAFGLTFLTVISVVVIILLAGFLIGLEKNTKRHDFTMALPFSRASMFITKYLLGLITILVSYSVAFWSGYLVVYQSEFQAVLSELNVSQTYLSPLLAFFVIYSFGMMIGTISGEMKSQLVLTFIFLIFPQGIFMLVYGLFFAHGVNMDSTYGNEFVFRDIFWFSYLDPVQFDINLIYPLVGGILFTGIGLFLFTKTQSEYSGEFLMFRHLHPVFAIGIPICTGLFGGYMLSGMVAYNASSVVMISMYWLGFIIGITFAWLITRKLLKRA
ncbi:ABC transporter permease [Halalkalibacillus halophilus]|uniref:ABC transporter permease n=1 Tax=Halalkalibacillus halophilus TaxID=392827 RepID=UPI000408A257|nr:ABC transporter permease [Halalkalibacillus halophilus]